MVVGRKKAEARKSKSWLSLNWPLLKDIRPVGFVWPGAFMASVMRLANELPNECTALAQT